jgi:uncharacterized protein YyaL (SSP411 family)
VETTFLTHITALRRAAFQAVREPQGAGRRDLANVQFHHRVNLPNRVRERNEAIRAMSMVNRKPAAYVCENFTCKAPVTDSKQLAELLVK